MYLIDRETENELLYTQFHRWAPSLNILNSQADSKVLFTQTLDKLDKLKILIHTQLRQKFVMCVVNSFNNRLKNYLKSTHW